MYVCVSYDLRCLIYSEGRAEVTRSQILWYMQHYCTACLCVASTQKAAIPLTTHPDLYDTVDQFLCSVYHTKCIGPCVYTTELAVVLNRVPSVNLAQNDADRLNDELGLTRYGPTNDLKKMVRLALSTKVPFTDLVSGLLLTPHTGRYLSLLLPYCESLQIYIRMYTYTYVHARS